MPKASRPYLTSGQYRRMKSRTNNKKKYTRPAYKKKKVYPSARGNYVPRAYNVETKIIELPVQTEALTYDAGTVTNPSNSLVVLPATWDPQTSLQVANVNVHDGVWATPCYINQKFRITMDKIVPDHADSDQGFTLKMIVGRLKITPDKFGARTTSFASYCADCLAQVKKELAESDMNSTFMEYSKRNRNIEIFSNKRIVPNRNGMIRKTIGQGSTGENYSAPPPIERSVNHRVAKLKTRVARAGDGEHTLFNNLWIPFTLFQCPELSANTGHIQVEQVSRLYFQDM